MNPNYPSLSASRRQTVNRIKSMVVYHFENVSSEIRPVDFSKLNRISPLNLSYALAELVVDGIAKRGGMYLVAGPKGYESHQAFVKVAPVAVEETAGEMMARFLDTCGRYEVAA